MSNISDQNRNGGSIAIFSSVQDFRLKRRGSIQAIAEELAELGEEVTFVSLRFSLLSARAGDPRMHLYPRSNRIERHRGVSCFLWWTLFHPFNTSSALLNTLIIPLFHIYGWYPSFKLDAIIRSANTIIIESGLSIALLPRIRRLNPDVRLLYRGSDRLSAISQHEILTRILRRHQGAFKAFCLLGPAMAVDFDWAFPKAYVVPPALDRRLVEQEHSNPFDTPLNAVSFGAMLIDISFFECAAAQFPEITFHIFGVPVRFGLPDNVIFHPEIAYAETWRYIRHATFGIAAYLKEPAADYLADTSSKLLQYGAVGLPAVCPEFAVGRHANRFGYGPGDKQSITLAIKRAMAAPHQPTQAYRTWADIVPRLLSPQDYPDTKLEQAHGGPRKTPVLSLIVATRGRLEPLARLFTSLKEQDPTLFELIVVDQNDPGVLDDLVLQHSEYLPLRHLRSLTGLSRARNVGLAACRGAIVGFPDDDCWYPPNRIEDVIRFFDVYDQKDILLGQTVDATGAPSVNGIRNQNGTVKPKNVWFSGNSNTLFLHSALAKTLQFDESLGVGAPTPFQSGEETDLILRALNQGAQACYCPNLAIYHDQVDRHIGAVEIRRSWRYAHGFGRVIRLHYSLHYMTHRVVRSLASSVMSLLRLRIRMAVYKGVWAVGTLHGYLHRNK